MFTRHLVSVPTLAAGALLLAESGAAQSRYLFSVAWTSPSVGMPASSGVAVTEGDLLRPTTINDLPALGPLPAPDIFVDHTFGLALPSVCVGHPGGTPCIVEVDAFSRGFDRPFSPSGFIQGGDILFSVDQYATGTGLGPDPSVRSEGAVNEAAPDAFFNLRPIAPGPVMPAMGVNIGGVDGNGAPSGSGRAYPGTGLIEPNAPFSGPMDSGDNQDALDLVEPGAGARNYFSLDSAFPDPLAGYANSGSAMMNGFVGGDILVASGGAGPFLFAPAMALGLDFVGGPDSDDLDALILWENGNGSYDPATAPYSWIGGTTDMVVFSVRRGSALIGQPDSLFGLPIEEGDLLMPPVPGGLSTLPGIFIPSENLGLATNRAGTAFTGFGDDLCAADSLHGDLFDCDGDGIEDAVAIASGIVPDVNMNGIPDPCESTVVGTPYCYCTIPAAPCGNASPLTGCLNVSSTGAQLTGSGSTSVALDNLVLTTSGMNAGTFALNFMGTSAVPPVNIGNGLLCMGGPYYRFPAFATGSGTASAGPGLAAFTLGWNPPAGQIVSGSTFYFQTYYRDIGGPCGSVFNLSNALSVTFTP